MDSSMPLVKREIDFSKRREDVIAREQELQSSVNETHPSHEEESHNLDDATNANIQDGLSCGNHESVTNTPSWEARHCDQVGTQGDHNEGVDEKVVVEEEEDQERHRLVFDLLDFVSMRENYLCSVCWEVLQTPTMVDECGHMFCQSCLNLSWKGNRRACPLCNKAVPIDGLLRKGNVKLQFLTNFLKSAAQLESDKDVMAAVLYAKSFDKNQTTENQTLNCLRSTERKDEDRFNRHALLRWDALHKMGYTRVDLATPIHGLSFNGNDKDHRNSVNGKNNNSQSYSQRNSYKNSSHEQNSLKKVYQLDWSRHCQYCIGKPPSDTCDAETTPSTITCTTCKVVTWHPTCRLREMENQFPDSFDETQSIGNSSLCDTCYMHCDTSPSSVVLSSVCVLCNSVGDGNPWCMGKVLSTGGRFVKPSYVHFVCAKLVAEVTFVLHETGPPIKKRRISLESPSDRRDVGIGSKSSTLNATANFVRLEADLSKVPSSRWSLQCLYCPNQGGAPLQCSVSSCRVAMHVFCALCPASPSSYEPLLRTEVSDGKWKIFCWKHCLKTDPSRLLRMEEAGLKTHNLQLFDKLEHISAVSLLPPAAHGTSGASSAGRNTMRENAVRTRISSNEVTNDNSRRHDEDFLFETTGFDNKANAKMDELCSVLPFLKRGTLQSAKVLVINTKLKETASRTFKLVYAAARGIPSVHLEWVEKCLARKTLINVEPYLIKADKVGTGLFQTYLHASKGNIDKLPLAGHKVALFGCFDSRLPERRRIEEVVMSLGGELVQDPRFDIKSVLRSDSYNFHVKSQYQNSCYKTNSGSDDECGWETHHASLLLNAQPSTCKQDDQLVMLFSSEKEADDFVNNLRNVYNTKPQNIPNNTNNKPNENSNVTSITQYCKSRNKHLQSRNNGNQDDHQGAGDQKCLDQFFAPSSILAENRTHRWRSFLIGNLTWLCDAVSLCKLQPLPNLNLQRVHDRE